MVSVFAFFPTVLADTDCILILSAPLKSLFKLNRENEEYHHLGYDAV
jgi:hypothetical protein